MPGQQWDVGRAYSEILKRVLDDAGVEMPFPHVTVYMGEDKQGKAPPLHLRSEPGASEPPAAMAQARKRSAN